VEADDGLRSASKADYRTPMVGNRGSPAFRCTCVLALEYSQARRFTWHCLSDVGVGRRLRTRVSGEFGRQNGVRAVISKGLKELKVPATSFTKVLSYRPLHPLMSWLHLDGAILGRCKLRGNEAPGSLKAQDALLTT